MAISFVGAVAVPADNGSHDDFSPVTFTAAALNALTLQDHDLLIGLLAAEAEGGGFTITNSVAAGQTWNALTMHSADPTSKSTRGFWAQYTPTLSADPAFALNSVNNFTGYGGVILVYRPTATTSTWSVDVAESAAAYAAPGGSFDVTTTGQTAVLNSALHLAWWTATGTPTWANQSSGSGWTEPGGQTQWRNAYSGAVPGMTISALHKIVTSAGASGNVTNRQSASRPGWQSIITFAETVITPDPPQWFQYQPRHNVHLRR